MESDFHFVSVNPNASEHEKMIRLSGTRSHLMRLARRAQSIRNHRNRTSNHAIFICENLIVDSTTKSKNPAQKGRPRLQISDEPERLETIRSGGLNPFATSALGTTTRRQNILIHHCLTNIWPGLIPMATIEEIPVMSANWMRAALEDPELLKSILFASDTHLKLLQRHSLDRDEERYQGQVDVYRRIRREATEFPNMLNEKIIMMVLQLASNDVSITYNDAPDYGLFTPPLADLQWLSVYGRVKPADSHWQALCYIIRQRGGLAGLETSGLAKVLSYVDIVYSTLTISRPSLPFHEIPNRILILRAQDSVGAVFKELEGGLGQLKHHGVDPQLIEVLRTMRRYQDRLQEYGSSDLSADERLQMAEDRNGIQHRLLSLPPGEPKTEIGRLSELLRLCSLLYSISVTFPVPQNRGLRRVLVWSIEKLLEPFQWDWLAYTCPEFLVWSLVVAGTSAFDLPNRNFFVHGISRLCLLNGWSEWSDVEFFLSDFLWLNSACDQAGMHLWAEVDGYVNVC